MMKSISQVIRMPYLTGAFNRNCQSDDDKVRLLSVVSRSSLSDDVPLMEDINSSEIDEAVRMDVKNEINPPAEPYFDAKIAQLIDVTDTTNQAVHPTAQNTDDEKRREWVFTLYDFDGKGTPNKEDILSIVRAIYDVLGNAKIGPRTMMNHVEKPKCDRLPFGAFKIKLSLTAVENADATFTNGDECRIVELRRHKKHQKTCTSTAAALSGRIKGDVFHTPLKVPPPPSNDADSSAANATGDLRSTSFDQRQDEELPLLRHHKKPTKRRVGGASGGTERYSPPPLQSRKLYRRSASFLQNNDPTLAASQRYDHSAADITCTSCKYRDYVNLSELENCCTSNVDHDQQRHARGGIHHIRHCDRHCHCPTPELTARHSMDNGNGCRRFEKGKVNFRHTACLLHPSPTTAVVRRCAELVQHPTASQYCRIWDSNGVYGATPSSTSMQVNVQARAYYQDRTSNTSMAGQLHKRVLSNSNKDNVITSTPCQESRNKSRDKDKHSMGQVRSWILTDSMQASPESAEQRGVADGSDRLYVEHKHIHKHNHYHHHYY